MNNKDNNEILSFEELRKKLGMDDDTSKSKKEKILFNDSDKNVKIDLSSKNKTADSEDDEFIAEIEKKLDEKIESEDGIKRVTENGKSFVDITEQYVKNEENPLEEEAPISPKKKKVRTFNEIFSDFFKKLIPLKKDSTKEKIRKIVMDISIITIICCVVAFGELYRQYRVQLKNEEDIKNLIVSTDNMDKNQYDEAWEEIFAKYPNIEMPAGMNLKYAYLYALNQDLVGWLKIDNTNLDVQVTQSDDNEYYLRRDFYQKKSRYGCPFIDYRNDPKYLEDNTIIYGHHMPDGLMFSQLDKYKTLEGYKDSPIIQYDTIYETYYFKVFAAFITNASRKEDNGNIFRYDATNFSTDDKFISFIDEVRQRSIFNTDISVEPDDKIITLSTCSYEFNEGRLVVMGRLVRENEDLNVDTSSATLNTSPRYPQAWYDAKGLTNPYKDAEYWTP